MTDDCDNYLTSGTLCEIDIDECNITKGICGHGICINVPGSYQCYCEPGFTGDNFYSLAAISVEIKSSLIFLSQDFYATLMLMNV